jgi:hypothetical protein
MKALWDDRIRKLAGFATAVLAALFLMSLAGICSRNAGAQDNPHSEAKDRLTTPPSRPPVDERDTVTAHSDPLLQSPTKVVPPSPPLYSAPSFPPPPAAPEPQALVAPPAPPLSNPCSRAAIAPPGCAPSVTEGEPSTEDMVRHLREVDQLKAQHLQTVQELERQKRTLLASIQKRLAEQKQQVEEIASATKTPGRPVPVDAATETTSTEKKLDAILIRLEKLERKLNAAERSPTYGPPVVVTGHRN